MSPWRSAGTSIPAVDSGYYGVAANLNTKTDYGTFAVQSVQSAIPIPGIVQQGPAITLRIDHGYVRAVAGHDLVFDVGLIESKPESER